MRRRIRIGRGRFRREVAKAVAQLPPRFRAATENVAVVVEERPRADDYDRRDDLDQRGGLFGVYRGLPLPERPSGYSLSLPDVIVVFRRPLLATCRTRRALRREIRLTILHELGHYFGLDEAQVDHL
jgi:predicted Zn-dependent protease with MMP-like domain